MCIRCQQEAEKRGYASGNAADWSRVNDGGSGDHEVSFNDIELDVS
jgi:hypothetical protein